MENSGFKHTPGPWSEKAIYWILRYADKHDGSWCDEVNENGKVYPVGYDDARLIAVAPEMLNIIISDLKINLKHMSFGDITFMRQKTNSEFNKKIDIVERATGMTIQEVLATESTRCANANPSSCQ